MSFDIPIEYGAVKLVAMICRIGAFVFAFPFFENAAIPTKYKILITIALAFGLMPCLGDVWGGAGVNAFRGITMLGMTTIVISELALGLAISLFVLASIEIFSYAGSCMDMDMGFSSSTIFDPSGESRTLFSSILSQLFIVAFLANDLHLEMIKILASSFQSLGPGAFALDVSFMEIAVRAMNTIFLVGIQMALPIMAAIFMINLGMGILARIGEDFPVMVLSFALHIAVGLLIFIVILPSTFEIFREVDSKLFEMLITLISEE